MKVQSHVNPTRPYTPYFYAAVICDCYRNCRCLVNGFAYVSASLCQSNNRVQDTLMPKFYKVKLGWEAELFVWVKATQHI